ncbi:MAG: type VI secretion system-associated protein TagF [Nitrospirae bacterium]|nr:type VI secretion system-associated protein TagF [Nitrospirota bacterium]
MNIGCFGKLPIYADFIRHNASSQEVRALDQWFQEGILWSQHQLNKDWDSAFMETPNYQFLYHPLNSDRVIVGIWAPNQDKGGRRYPFSIFVLVDRSQFDSHLPLVPTIFSEFLSQAEEIIQKGWEDTDVKGLISKINQINLPAYSSLDEFQQGYINYLKTQTNQGFWEGLLGDFHDRKKYIILHTLVEVLSPLRSQYSQRLTWGLRFPLSSRPEDHVHEISLWLDITLYLLGNLSIVPNLFWSQGSVKAGAGLFLYFREPPPKSYIHLLCPDVEDDSLCDLARSRMKLTDPIIQRYKSLLDTPDISLQDLLSSYI